MFTFGVGASFLVKNEFNIILGLVFEIFFGGGLQEGGDQRFQK
jgi:hypothetical protein